MMDFKNSIPNFGSRFRIPENIRLEDDCNRMITKFAVKMAEEYDAHIADQIAMEARKAGATDCVVLNRKEILNALSKQIPKLPIMTQDYILCPTCRWDMMGVWDYPDVRDPKYCPECGQRLKWRE